MSNMAKAKKPSLKGFSVHELCDEIRSRGYPVCVWLEKDVMDAHHVGKELAGRMLNDISGTLEDAMVERGWNVIDGLDPNDYKE